MAEEAMENLSLGKIKQRNIKVQYGSPHFK